MKNYVTLFSAICSMSVIFFATPHTAQAEAHFAPTIFYYVDGRNNSGNETTETTTAYDIKFGVNMNGPLYLGGIYAIENVETESNSGTSNHDRTSLGATVGYYQKQSFWILGHYFLQSEVDAGAPSSDHEGTGIGIDIGYYWSLGGSSSIGPMLTHRIFDYDENGDGNDLDLEETKTMIYVAFNVSF